MNKWDIDNDKLDFLDVEETDPTKLSGRYKVLIADDEDEVHRITKLILRDYVFENMGLEFIDTYSGEETKKVLEEDDDIAILFLDVVMESNTSGLEVVEYLRNELKNSFTRIILRTGQPGEAPEESIIRDYDINDYRLKTELTTKRMLTSMYAAIRSYRDLKKLEKHQQGLKKIIKASASLFENNSLDKFLISILEQLSSFQEGNSDIVYLRKSEESLSSGFVTMVQSDENEIVAATGKFKPYIGMSVEEIPELVHVYNYLNSEHDGTSSYLRKIKNGFVVSNQEKSSVNNYIYIEGDQDLFDYDLINLFLSNFSIALDNFILNNMLNDTQKEIVFALAETVESHFDETGHHIKRISKMMYNFSILLHYSFKEAELLRLASTMHDLGKVAIPDSILKKPGKLTVEEFDVIKTHTSHGYKILTGTDLPVLKNAAEIALNHHEKYDGTGYPGGKKDKNIPLNARMMAIVDVYDAMTNKRVYKDAVSREETLDEMLKGRGTHFDPKLLDLFVENLDEILTD